MKKILLTGATGMLGSSVAKALLAKNITIRALVQKKPTHGFLPVKGIEYVQADITSPETLPKALRGIDSVIHCAGLVNGSGKESFFKVNGEGTKNLVKAAEKGFVQKFVHVSTADVVFRKGAYSLSKLAGENAVKTSKLNWVVVRPTAIYDKSLSKLTKAILMAKRHPIVPVLGSGRQKLQPVWVEDVADFLVKALLSQKAVGKVYTLASNKPVSMNQLVDLVAKACGKRVAKLHLPMSLLFAAAFLNETLSKKPFLNRDQLALLSKDKPADSNLAIKELGFRPKTIEEGIKQILAS